jgi:hypothetical protein
MDPWLEDPGVWPDVHASLLVTFRSLLGPLVRPRYYVRVEVRLYEAEIAMADAAGVADVGVQRRGERTDAGERRLFGAGGVATAPAEAGAVTAVVEVEIPLTAPVRERYLTIRSVETHDVVTVIELLSPANKRAGEGRRQYLEKRSRIAGSLTNLIEVDLLRAGQPVPLWRDGAPLSAEALGTYRVVISRGRDRPQAHLLPFGLRGRLPAVPVPLRPGDAEPRLDLGQALTSVYDQGSYDLALDYRRGPVPPLEPADAAWADALLRNAGLR